MKNLLETLPAYDKAGPIYPPRSSRYAEERKKWHFNEKPVFRRKSREVSSKYRCDCPVALFKGSKSAHTRELRLHPCRLLHFWLVLYSSVFLYVEGMDVCMDGCFSGDGEEDSVR